MFFPKITYKFRDHHRRSVGLLWAFCGFSVSNICASIIMMQKVAANVDNVAADLCFRASEVRWLLMKIFFCYCRYFCRYFLCTSINIVMPYLRHFSSFVPKIYDFERRIGVNNMRKLLYYNNFRMGVFFFEKSFFARRLCRKLCRRLLVRLH